MSLNSSSGWTKQRSPNLPGVATRAGFVRNALAVTCKPSFLDGASIPMNRPGWLPEHVAAATRWAFVPGQPSQAAGGGGDVMHSLDFERTGHVAPADRGVQRGRLGRVDRVPELPPHYLEREEEVEACCGLLLRPGATTVAITSPQEMSWTNRGMGGAGKSVLAAAVARDPRIRRRFADGIFWVTAGQENAGTEVRATAMQFSLAARLGCPIGLMTSQKGRQQLQNHLADKSCLIILDDVCESVDALRMNIVDRRSPSRVLITTRDGRVATDLNASEVPLGNLSIDQAAAWLADWCGRSIETDEDALAVAHECGYLPLGLAVVGAMARVGIPWEYIAAGLRDANLSFLSRSELDPIDTPVLRAISASIDHLRERQPETAARYCDLAIFPRGESIPESVVLMLWEQTTDCSRQQFQADLRTLEKSALLRIEGDAPNRRVSLHDLPHDLIRRTHPSLTKAHYQLLEGYRQQCPEGWPGGPADGYFFEFLGYHLRGAGRKNELRTLLLRADWLSAKLRACGVVPLISDYESFSGDEVLSLVRGALRLSAPNLERDPSLLRGQLRGRLQGVAPAEVLIDLERAVEPTPWLRSLTPSLTAPGDPLVRALDGHTACVRAVAMSPDGKHALSASNDHSLRLWDLAEGKTIHELRGHTDLVNAVVLTPKGKFALSASNDRTLRLWDLSSGESIHEMVGHDNVVSSVVLTPDGMHALSASYDHTLRLWNLSTGYTIREFRGHKNIVTSVVITPDGKQALSASWDHTLRLWDLATGETLRVLHGHTGWLATVVTTPDGKHALSASWDHTLRLWELETGTTVRELKGHTGWLTAVVVTPDGKQALSASSDQTLRLWDLATGKTIHELKGHSSLVNAVEITPDGKHALSASWDQTLRLWDLATGKTVREIQGHTNMVNAVELSPDGKHALSASWDQTLQLWDLATAKTVGEHSVKGHSTLVNAVALAPDGAQALSASWDHALRLWDIATGKTVRELQGHTNLVTAVVVTPDGRNALSASWDQTLRLWDLATGKSVREFRGHTGWLTAVTLTPDGRQAITGSNDKSLRLWDLATGKSIREFKGHSDQVTAVVVTPDGKRALSASWDHTLRLWDLATGKTIREIEGQNVLVTAVALSPDGKQVLSSSHDHALRLWDLATGETIRLFPGHTNLVNSIVITPNGKHALSASDDHTLRLWDMRTGRLISSFAADNPLTNCGVSAQGSTFVGRDSGGRVHLLRLNVA